MSILMTSSNRAMLTDAYNSTKIFGYTQSGSQIMQLLGPALSSASMMHNLWLPFWMGLGCLILVVPSIALLPETRRHLGKDREALDSLVHDGVVTSHMHLWEESKSLKKSIRLVVRKVYLQWKDFRLLMSSSRNFSLCLVIFLVTTLARGSQGILLQYVSKRYDKTFAEVSRTVPTESFRVHRNSLELGIDVTRI